MLHNLNSWPSIWEDDDFQLLPSLSNNLDVFETENEFVVKASVAGVDEDDIDVTFEKGVLWIQAKSTKEDAGDEKYYSKSSWNYSYKVSVPGIVDYQKEPELTVDNGVLKIKFAKSEASKPRKLLINKK
jgi:HSP20 family protein